MSFIMNRLSNQRRSQVIAALIEGNSVRATCRLTGVCKDAVLKLICDVGKACADHHNRAVRGVKTKRVQCDEIWSFCYAKEKNVPVEKQGTGAGSVWTWTAIDADSKLIILVPVRRTGRVLGLPIHGGFSIACDHAHSDHD